MADMYLLTLHSSKCSCKVLSSLAISFTKSRNIPLFNDSCFSIWPHIAISFLPQNFKKSAILFKICLFFCTNSLCCVIDSLCLSSISVQISTFSFIFNFNELLIWEELISCDLILSDRYLRSLIPWTVHETSPPNNRQLKQKRVFLISLAVNHGFLLYQSGLKEHDAFCVKDTFGWSGPNCVITSFSWSLNVLNVVNKKLTLFIPKKMSKCLNH